MDIAVQLIINQGEYTLDQSKQNKRLVNGDIVRVHDPLTLATKTGQDWIPNDAIGSPRTGFIFVTGIIDGFTTIEKINSVLFDPVWDYTDPDQPVMLQRKEWNVNLGGMNPPTFNALMTDKHVTVSWNQFKSWCLNKSGIEIDYTDFAV